VDRFAISYTPSAQTLQAPTERPWPSKRPPLLPDQRGQFSVTPKALAYLYRNLQEAVAASPDNGW